MTLPSSTITTTHQTSIEYQLVRQQHHGKPNVLFLNGYRTHFNTWHKLIEPLTNHANLLFYNRLGIGKSSCPKQKQTGEVVLRDLRELLTQTSFNPPYLIVAHSLGGIFAELYARKYPNEVRGVVLVDTPHAEEIPVMKAYKIPWPLRILNALLQVSDKLRGRYLHSEDEEIINTLASLNGAGEFPPIPVAVVSGSKKMPFLPDHFFQTHQAFQRKLLQLSPRSRQFVCEQSSHFPQLSEPQRVVQAVHYVLGDCSV